MLTHVQLTLLPSHPTPKSYQEHGFVKGTQVTRAAGCLHLSDNKLTISSLERPDKPC